MAILKHWFQTSEGSSPPLFLAPMAGVTHSAFRRLVSDFGGYTALFTEMLSPKALIAENFAQSPFTRTRECEGAVVFQLRITGDEPVERLIQKIMTAPHIAGIDINLGCPAPEIRKMKAGVALFDDLPRLATILSLLRKEWKGTLTVKCRLGNQTPDWQEQFLMRLKLFEETGMDAVTVHPRFANEKLKRTARWHHFPWVIENSSLPIIANGDLCERDQVEKVTKELGCSGAMIGRMSAVQPWIFKKISTTSEMVDLNQTWNTFFDYCLEDFPPEKAIGRIKEFASYYGHNFFYGHEFYRAIQGSETLGQIKERAAAFLSNAPRLAAKPNPSSLI